MLLSLFWLATSIFSQNDLPNTPLPEALQSNWFNPEDGAWFLGFYRNQIAYDGDLWQYYDIKQEDKLYRIDIQKADTICYYNASGQYICEWKERQASLTLQANANKELIFNEGEKHLLAIKDPRPDQYQPRETLPESFEPGFAIFKGWVINADQEQIDQGITLYVNDLYYADQKSYSSAIDENGFFFVKVPLTTAQDLYLRPGKSIFLEPGKTLVACINAQKKGDIIFMGPHAELNRDLSLFWRDPGNNVDFRKDRKNMVMEPEAYKLSRQDLERENQGNYQQFIKRNTVSPAFHQWFEVYSSMRYYDDLMRYSWLRKRFGEQEPLVNHPTYFSFINEVDLNDPKNRITGYFQSFLYELRIHYLRRAGKRPFAFPASDPRFLTALINSEQDLSEPTRSIIGKYLEDPDIEDSHPNFPPKELLEQLAKEYPDLFYTSMIHARINSDRTRLDSLLDNSPKSDLIRQYEWLSGLNQHLDQGKEAGIAVYWSLIQQRELPPGVFEHLQYRYDEVMATIEKPLPNYAEITNVPEGSAQALMQDIARKHAGKRVYFDIWATWCSPCHQEMKNSTPMKKAFKQSDIVAVYLCADGAEQQMEHAIKKYELAGDHYFLSKRVSRELRENFSISGYPTYMIMNKEGQVVNQKAPRPSNLSALMKEMERLE